MATPSRQRASTDSTPAQVGAATTPPPYPSTYDHNFTLQAVMELQKSTGQLTEAVASLRNSIEKQDVKLDKIETSLSGITHKLYAAGVVLAILLTIGGFIINKAWDLMAKQITETKTAQTK